MSKHKRRKVMPKYRKVNIIPNKLKCYIEEYGDNNARLRSKQNNKIIKIVINNEDEKIDLLDFLSEAKLYRSHAPSMYDRNGKDFVEVIGIIEKEDIDNIYINMDLCQFRKTDVKSLNIDEISDLERITTEDDIDFEVDALFNIIEYIEDKYHVILFGERNNINRAYYDWAGKPYMQTKYVFANWKKGILDRYNE